MKKYVLTLAAAGTMMFFGSQPVEASPFKAKERKELTAEETLRMEQIENRVAEIQGLDFSEMEKAEKKALKSELKSLEKEAKSMRGGGIYISTGAIIVILLLIIIL
ncbi:hypothetical protein [Mongoliitalea lutea]|uniref:Seryl-tRNA synthetase n=1 Tax=Mongoliitalea lutea TaxID=849756 RepID=A0A8J3D0M2_9BACT|nr:hypothetical protein [Mongoliitalea lutea]GHB46444.1 hypothetical protein GCM10008106_29240 [Mongoliitalea lutea]